IGNQKPALPRSLLHRVCGVWKVEYRDAFNSKVSMIDLRVSSDFHVYLVRVKLPLRARQFAGRDFAVSDDVTVRAGLLHDPAGKEKWVGAGENGAAFSHLQANAPDHMLEMT